MNTLASMLPGAEFWEPYLEKSPVTPADFAASPWSVFCGFLPETLGETVRNAVRGYADVLLFLLLSAVIALLLGEQAEGALLDLVSACGCGVLLLAKMETLAETLCEQIEHWNQFLLGFLPVYAGVLAMGGESAAGTSANGFLLTLLCGLSQGITAFVPSLLKCYLALSMACCISRETSLGICCKTLGSALQHGIGWAGKLLAALLGVQRFSTLQLDRTTLRAGRLLSGTVPIIGETLKDVSEAVLSSVQLLKSGLGIAALGIIVSEFVPVYLGMLLQLGLLMVCGLLCSLTGNQRCQNLIACFTEAVRCMMAVTVLFAGLSVMGTALLFLVGGG